MPLVDFDQSIRVADGSSGAVPETANALRIPIQGAVGSVVEWMRGIYGYIYRYDKLLAENESLRRQLAEAQDALQAAQRLFKEALPKFNWGASFLDANAIQLLNEVPAKVNAAIRAAKVEKNGA